MQVNDEESRPILDGSLKPISDKSQSPEIDEGTKNDEGTPRFGFFYFGILGMLCFNIFLQAANYLNQSFNPKFIGWANVLYGLSNNCGQLVAIFTGSRFSFFNRIWISSLGLALVIIGLPIFAQTNLSIRTSMGYLLTFGLGLCNAIMQSAGFGLAGSVSSRAVNWYSFGQAVSGLLGMPLILGLVSLFSYLGYSSTAIGKEPSPVDAASTITALVISAVLTLSMIPYYYFLLSTNPVVAKTLLAVETPAPASSWGRYVGGIVAVLPMAISVWVVMFLTFLAFPGQIFVWTPSFGQYPGGKTFFVGMMIFCFQLFDVVGRYLAIAGVTMTPLLVMCLSPWRFVLVLLLYVCSYDWWIFANDFVRLVLMALLAATNGFFISWTMILGPKQGKRENADVASYTMSFFLVNGILCGSLVALAIAKVLSDSPAEAERFSVEMQNLVRVGTESLNDHKNDFTAAAASGFR